MTSSKRVMRRFGKTLAAIRQLKGLSQAELAQKAKLAPTWISQLETGKRLPSFITLQKLVGALDVDASVLVELGEGR